MKTQVKALATRCLRPEQKLWLSYQRPSTLDFLQTPAPMIFILQSAAHSRNAGDYVMALQQRYFLQQCYPTFTIQTLYSDTKTASYRRLKRRIRPKDLVVIQGGGNLGDTWAQLEYDRQLIVSTFKQNRIVILPESVYFSPTEAGQHLLHRSQRLYQRHPQLSIFARDQISYQRLQTYFPKTTCALVPDIVLTATDLKRFGASKTTVRQENQVLLLLRKDKEKRYTGNVPRNLQVYPELEYITADTVLDRDQGPMSEAVQDLIDKIQQSRFVITDRLHGLIFCYLTQTPCLFLDNLDHKLRHFYDTWLTACPWLLPTTEATLAADIKRSYQTPIIDNHLDLTPEFEALEQALKLS